MKIAALQRLGGIAIITGSVLFTLWAICWTTLLPAQERARDMSLVIRHPNWVWIASLALSGILLMIFGFTAVYSRLYQGAGVTGLIGYVFVALAYILEAAEVTWEIALYPAIVRHGPSVPLFSERILWFSPEVKRFRSLAELTIFLGVILFSKALIQSKEFPKIAGILIASGAVVYAVGPAINIYLAILGVVVLSAGCFILGRRLMSAAQ